MVRLTPPHLLLLHCCCRCSLVKVEKEVEVDHLVALPHFLRLDVFHLWMPPCQLVVHLDVKLGLPLELTKYSPSLPRVESCQWTSLGLLLMVLDLLHQSVIARLA